MTDILGHTHILVKVIQPQPRRIRAITAQDENTSSVSPPVSRRMGISIDFSLRAARRKQEKRRGKDPTVT